MENARKIIKAIKAARNVERSAESPPKRVKATANLEGNLLVLKKLKNFPKQLKQSVGSEILLEVYYVCDDLSADGASTNFQLVANKGKMLMVGDNTHFCTSIGV